MIKTSFASTCSASIRPKTSTANLKKEEQQ